MVRFGVKMWNYNQKCLHEYVLGLVFTFMTKSDPFFMNEYEEKLVTTFTVAFYIINNNNNNNYTLIFKHIILINSKKRQS